jgi:hypothetical protein
MVAPSMLPLAGSINVALSLPAFILNDART